VHDEKFVSGNAVVIKIPISSAGPIEYIQRHWLNLRAN